MSDAIEDESGRYLKKESKDGLPARAVGPWANEKLSILSTYMNLFTVGMKPTHKKKHNWSSLVYVDLFAGPGKCIIRSNENEILGSPLLATKTPFRFTKLYFVEAEQWANEALKLRVASDIRCVVIGKNCNEAVEQIIHERTPNTLYLAFIDPTGLDIHFATIKKLTQGVPCDLIINWYMSALTRNLPYWQKTKESERLDTFFGTHDWKKPLEEKLSNRVIFQRWVELYRGQLQSIGYCHQPEPRIIKNTRGNEMYWLWFASKNKLGFKYWKAANKSSAKHPELDFT